MNGRIAPAVVVVALVLLAGCIGGVGDSPSGTPTDEVDGVDDGDGSEDGGATLAENRTAALMAAGSYTTLWQMTFVNASEGENRLAYTHAVDYENERSRFAMETVDEGTESSLYESFHGAGTSYTRHGSGEDATYSVGEAPFAPRNTLFPVEGYVSARGLSEFSATGTETYDGVTVTRYERTDRPTWIGQQAGDADVTWTEFTYVVLVDGEGLVRYESWGAEGVDAHGAQQSMEFSYALTGVGSTTIDDPDWLGAAEAQSSA